MKEPIITLTLDEYNQICKERETLLDKNIKLSNKNAELSNKIDINKQEIDRLRWQIADLTRRLWSKSSEKRHLPENSSQLDICFGSPTDVVNPIAEEAKCLEEAKKSEKEYDRFRKNTTKKITPHARKPIDPSLPRETIIVPMPENTCMEGAIKIGEEVSEQYAVRPAFVYVQRIVRYKYKLPNGQIVIAPMPIMAHPRSNASESILTHIAVTKYHDHLPLNRQLEIFEREGIHLSPSTVSNWMMAAAIRLEPIYNELREQVKKSYYVMADETPHPVLESNRPGSLHRGYMWDFYIPDLKAPYFEYHTGRGKSGISTLLAGQVKVVQSDGFVVYDQFDTLPGSVHLSCWAHVRRKFVEAESNDPPKAKYALDQIRILYEVERQIKEKSLEGEAVVKLRREKSYPIIKDLERWCKEEYLNTTHGSLIAKAMFYMYTRFEQLSGYVNQAQFQIDNNPIERSIRPLTLNRKNTLFSGSHEAAHAAAIFFSLMGCCRENNVNPKEWMQEALIKVQDTKLEKENDYSTLLPFNWRK